MGPEQMRRYTLLVVISTSPFPGKAPHGEETAIRRAQIKGAVTTEAESPDLDGGGNS